MSDVPPSGLPPPFESIIPPSVQRQLELLVATKSTASIDIEARQNASQHTYRFWIAIGSIISVLGGGGFVGMRQMRDVDSASKGGDSTIRLEISNLKEKNIKLEADLKAANDKIIELEKAQGLNEQALDQHKGSSAKAGHGKLR